MSVPLGKFGFWLPRTLSRAISSRREDSPEPFHIRDSNDPASEEGDTDGGLRRRPGAAHSSSSLPQHVRAIGRSIIPQSQSRSRTPPPNQTGHKSVSTPSLGTTAEQLAVPPGVQSVQGTPAPGSRSETPQIPERTIRYMDEQHVDAAS